MVEEEVVTGSEVQDPASARDYLRDDEEEEDIESHVQVVNKLIEPGIDVDTSKIKIFIPGTNRTKTRLIDTRYRNLVSRNVATSNLNTRLQKVLVMMSAVSLSAQARQDMDTQKFCADFVNIVSNTSKAGRPEGGQQAHLAISKIAIRKEEPLLKAAEEEEKPKKKWGLL